MEKDSKEAEEKISQLQLYEQSLQNLLMQKQQFQGQLIEIESALKELEKSSESYKIVGNVMVKAKKDDVIKDLDEKKSALDMRLKSLEKQEESIKKKAESLRSEVMDKIKDE
ncbi:prefoldin subunit beta [Candidatus Woesearchaeota archaeon]|nr:prefoldin subunit beta [Candidatus Woesearchaeota archaeon]